MASVKTIRQSLRFRIVALTGGVIVVLMLVISTGIMLQWRSLILNKLRNRAESVTRAFAISVLDALIYSETEEFRVENLLETYINDLKNDVPGIRYIMVTNNSRRIIAHTDPAMYNRVLNDSLSVLINKAQAFVSGVYRSANHGWIIETALPLQIYGKRWGMLRIAFDAQKTRNEIRHLFFFLLVLTAMVTMVVLFVLWYLINHMFHSLDGLVEAMDSMDLEPDAVVPLPERDDEIGFLIRHFEMLRQRLYQSHQKLLSAQKQVYHAEKLASVGRLASGVAHEINNPLNGIKNCVYAIQQNPDDKEQLQKYMNLIDEGLNHIETVVQKLLGFARTPAKSVATVDVNQMIKQVVELLDYRLKQKQIDVRLEIDSDLPLIKADYSLLQEVIMNLLINSYDAVGDGGTVVVQTKRARGDAIQILLKDNGIGIPAERLNKIFDPFYTTKDPGVGTGLGLSVALDIVQAHGGKIDVNSEEGKGTVFIVTLPIGEIE